MRLDNLGSAEACDCWSALTRTIKFQYVITKGSLITVEAQITPSPHTSQWMTKLLHSLQTKPSLYSRCFFFFPACSKKTGTLSVLWLTLSSTA